MNELVAQLKDDGQDFEWYPTTDEMIRVVADKMTELFPRSGFSLLDIGAGDGRVLSKIDAMHRRTDNWGNIDGGVSEAFAIEKSQILINNLPENVIVIGTDFDEQTLIDKQVTTIFCNPPYSVFERWMTRIIKEANSQYLFFVVPQRWKENKEINTAIANRKGASEVLLSSDFLNAERAARAKVDVVFIDLSIHEYYARDEQKVDPFELWFDETFPRPVSESSVTKQQIKTEVKDQLVKGKNQISVLVDLYRKDLEKLVSNYQAVCKLDPAIVKELGVSVCNLRDGLKTKIKGLKSLYWEELFSNLESITNRLTSVTRKEMLDKLNKNMNVDFTEANVYAIVIWALKNANKYIDRQLLDVYMKMTAEENVLKYRSNTHMTKDSWRYCRPTDDVHHYSLDYRVVLYTSYAIKANSSCFSCDFINNLGRSAHTYIGDIFTVAKNLGFNVINDTEQRDWKANTEEEFFFTDNGENKLFCKIRAFKNGNIHVKFNQDFMRAFNVEAGRLNGWIKSPSDASKEMDMSEDEAEAAFMSNIQINTVPLLGI